MRHEEVDATTLQRLKLLNSRQLLSKFSVATQKVIFLSICKIDTHLYPATLDNSDGGEYGNQGESRADDQKEDGIGDSCCTLRDQGSIDSVELENFECLLIRRRVQRSCYHQFSAKIKDQSPNHDPSHSEEDDDSEDVDHDRSEHSVPRSEQHRLIHQQITVTIRIFLNSRSIWDGFFAIVEKWLNFWRFWEVGGKFKSDRCHHGTSASSRVRCSAAYSESGGSREDVPASSILQNIQIWTRALFQRIYCRNAKSSIFEDSPDLLPWGGRMPRWDVGITLERIYYRAEMSWDGRNRVKCVNSREMKEGKGWHFQEKDPVSVCGSERRRRRNWEKKRALQRSLFSFTLFSAAESINTGKALGHAVNRDEIGP